MEQFGEEGAHKEIEFSRSSVSAEGKWVAHQNRGHGGIDKWGQLLRGHFFSGAGGMERPMREVVKGENNRPQ